MLPVCGLTYKWWCASVCLCLLNSLVFYSSDCTSVCSGCGQPMRRAHTLCRPAWCPRIVSFSPSTWVLLWLRAEIHGYSLDVGVFWQPLHCSSTPPQEDWCPQQEHCSACENCCIVMSEFLEQTHLNPPTSSDVTDVTSQRCCHRTSRCATQPLLEHVGRFTFTFLDMFKACHIYHIEISCSRYIYLSWLSCWMLGRMMAVLRLGEKASLP